MEAEAVAGDGDSEPEDNVREDDGAAEGEVSAVGCMPVSSGAHLPPGKDVKRDARAAELRKELAKHLGVQLPLAMMLTSAQAYYLNAA